jgi:hypothetical protein
MDLTEQQIAYREEIFLEFLDTVSKDFYEVEEGYEMTEEDAYFASILMDYFVENYRQPTIQEAAGETLSGVSINEELISEMLEVMLDESLGTFIAGAAHGIRNLIAGHKAHKAAQGAEKAHAAERAAKEKHTAAKKDARAATNLKATGLKSTLKKAYHTAKTNTIASKAEKSHEKALDKHVAASNKASSAKKAHAAGVEKTHQLASRIDKGVENVKNKVKKAITPGAAKIASAAGKVAGKFA